MQTKQTKENQERLRIISKRQVWILDVVGLYVSKCEEIKFVVKWSN